MAVLQLDFFAQEETEIFRFRMSQQDERIDKYRKSQFAQIGMCRKRIDDLEKRLEIIERGLCNQEDHHEHYEYNFKRFEKTSIIPEISDR